MSPIKVILENGLVLDYEFQSPPSMDQIDAAMDGIGGRPSNRKPPSLLSDEEAGAPL